MTILQITEYAASGLDVNGVPAQIAKEPALAYQEITTSGTSAASAAFNADTRLIRISADAAVRIRFGANPTALATDTRVIADATEYFGVIPGQKIAAIVG